MSYGIDVIDTFAEKAQQTNSPSVVDMLIKLFAEAS